MREVPEMSVDSILASGGVCLLAISSHCDTILTVYNCLFKPANVAQCSVCINDEL